MNYPISRLILLAAPLLVTPLSLWAQAPAPSTAAPAAGVNRLLGTVTASSDDSITLKLEKGDEVLVTLTPTTKLVRTAPGQTTLVGATVIRAADLSTGDRVLVRAVPGVDATHYTASAVIAMKQADIAQARASQSEDWQKRGVGGIVKTVDPAALGTLTVGSAGRTLTIHLTPATVVRRYASDSVNFADAKPSTLGEIHPGDQLRARGDKSADGAEVAAVEIVAGSFRNIAGTVLATNPADNTLTVTDLATKKPVTLKLTPETQMRKLPPQMAQRLAGRTGEGPSGAQGPGGPGGGPGGGAGAGPAAGPAGAPADPGAMASGTIHRQRPTSGPAPGGAPGSPATSATGDPGGPGEARAHSSDPAAMLSRAPTVTLAELNKGDAVMIVATAGGGTASDAATAITLIAGVEPLLEKSSSAASQNLFSASWNLNGGGGEGQQ